MPRAPEDSRGRRGNQNPPGYGGAAYLNGPVHQPHPDNWAPFDGSGLRINRAVRDALRGAGGHSAVGITQIQSGNPNGRGYVKDGDKAYILLPFKSGAVTIHLGSRAQDLYRLNDQQTAKLQQWMYDAGLYADDVYDGRNVATGDPNDGGLTATALAELFGRALLSGKSTSQYLKDQIAANSAALGAKLDKNKKGLDDGLGGDSAQQVADQIVDNPFQPIHLTHPTTLRGVADEMAQDVFGRNATEEEKSKFVAFFQNQERLFGTIVANKEQESRYNSAGVQQANLVGQTQLNNSGAAGSQGVGGITGGAKGAITYPVVGHTGADLTTNTYGMPWGDHRHAGLDLFAAKGTPIVAARGGVVVKVQSGGYEGGHANSVTIRGDDGRFYYYTHMVNSPPVKKDQVVTQGQLIGNVGRTGNAYKNGKGAYHVHFVIAKTANTTYEAGAYDPYNELRGSSSVTSAGAAPTGGSAGGGGAPGGGGGGGVNVLAILDTIANFESNHTYNAGITGMYGLTPTGGWKVWGDGSAKYASQASKAAQDAAATKGVNYWLGQGIKPEDIPLVWYLGHYPKPGEMDVVPGKKGQNRYTPREYQKMWVDYLHAHGGAGGGGGIDPATGQPYMGGIVGTTTANTYEDLQAPDQREAAEEQFRKDHPDEAGAHDLSKQYDQFVTLLSGFSGQKQ
jgi:murein DD-endopeptidase MepM/ murein hydrolase activator NlpD